MALYTLCWCDGSNSSDGSDVRYVLRYRIATLLCVFSSSGSNAVRDIRNAMHISVSEITKTFSYF